MKSFFLYLSCGFITFLSNRFYNIIKIDNNIINIYFLILLILVIFEILFSASVIDIEIEKYSIRLLRKIKTLMEQGKNFKNSIKFLAESKDEERYEYDLKAFVSWLDTNLDSKKSSYKFASRINSQILEKYLPQLSENPNSISYALLDEELEKLLSSEFEEKNKNLRKYLNLLGILWFLVGVFIYGFVSYFVYKFITSIFGKIFLSINCIK